MANIKHRLSQNNYCATYPTNDGDDTSSVTNIPMMMIPPEPRTYYNDGNNL